MTYHTQDHSSELLVAEDCGVVGLRVFVASATAGPLAPFQLMPCSGLSRRIELITAYR